MINFIHQVGPNTVVINSRFYKHNQLCAYHSNNVGHDTEDHINLEHEIEDLIDQRVVNIQTSAPNIYINYLPNHGGININIIQTEVEWCTKKAIVSVGRNNLEKVVALFSNKFTNDFIIMTSHKAIDLVKREISP